MEAAPRLRIVGPGRAGLSLAGALAERGWVVAPAFGRHDDPSTAAAGVDLVVISTPDAAITAVASAIAPSSDAVVAHLSGALGLDVLVPHQRVAALHPLATLPDRVTGATTLAGGVWWAVEGDALAADVVSTLGGHLLGPNDRMLYHATACVAANHVVALMGQLERLAKVNGLPAAPFYDLAQAALANARRSGAPAALTGPAARGDVATVERHLASLPPEEIGLYRALSDAAHDMANRELVSCR